MNENRDTCPMAGDFRLQFSIWRNAAGNQKSEVTGQGYILFYS